MYNHCKSKDIIDYYLNNTYVSMFLQSLTIDEKQIPMTRTYIENPYTTASKNFFKDFQIFLKILVIEGVTGIIKSKINYNNNSFCEIIIKLSDKKTVYKRQFEKITSAFSKAGSLMTLIYSFV